MRLNKIRVYFQYPWKFPDSSYYKNILDFPPENAEYINYKKSMGMEVIGSSKKFEAMRVLKNFIRKFLKLVRVPNLVFTTRGDFDLIHCAHCLPLNDRPFVVDTEVYDRLASAGGDVAIEGIGKKIIKKILERENCKKIIAWSGDCKRSFETAFPKDKKILDKIEIVPFAIPKFNYKKIPHKNLRILFVARWFDAKGGRQTLEIFDRLSKKYKTIEFIFICPTPKNYKEKYARNKQIKILDLLPQKKLFEKIYPSADIFFYPGFGDSYGFAVPEALAFGLPVITSKTFGKTELVSDGKTGFIIDVPKDFWSYKNYSNMNEKMLNEFYSKTLTLIKNKGLRRLMSINAKRTANKNFSIKNRNKKLSKIYQSALE
ncbi:MAG: glycosyltransferase family 4 protein [Nanoarchaeota archaeon]|nr:glycosyltransferase family 4 protein [Nanoarchaeota archaeon]